MHPLAPLMDTLNFVNHLHVFDAEFDFACVWYATIAVYFSSMYSD